MIVSIGEKFHGHHSFCRHHDSRRASEFVGGEHDHGHDAADREEFGRCGIEGIELISGSHLKKCVRELKEDPWERVRLVSKIITKTPLRLIAGRVNTFEFNPPSMYRLFVERMAANGIREAPVYD